MTDWKSQAVMQHQLEAGKAMLGVSIGIFAYDSILSFPFDMSILRGKRQRRWPQVAYFLTKIFLTGYLVITLILNYTQYKINCQIGIDMLEMLMGFTVVSSSVLLACRTICVYEGPTRALVTSTLLILACGLLAAWMQGVTAVTSRWDTAQAPLFTDGVCNNTAIRSDYWVKYVCTIIFDAVVLFLTVFGIVQLNGSSRIGVVLVRQGIVYFLLTFIVNLLITIFTLLQLSVMSSLLLAVPQTTICVICACRLYINLAKEARPSSNEHSSSRATSAMTPASVAKNVQGQMSHSSQTNSSGSQGKKSAMARIAHYVFGGKEDGSNGGVERDAQGSVPSYFSSSSHPHARRAHGVSTAGAGGRGAPVAAVYPTRTHGQQVDSDDLDASAPYGQARVMQMANHSSNSNSLGSGDHHGGGGGGYMVSRHHPLDLEKQQPPRPALSTDPSYEQFYDTRSTTDTPGVGIAQPMTTRTHDDDVEGGRAEEILSHQPVRMHRNNSVGASVPPRRSSNGGAGVQVETARYLPSQQRHYTPPHSNDAHASQVPPVPAYTPPANQVHAHQYQPWSSDVRQSDDEVVQTHYPRLVARKDAPRH